MDRRGLLLSGALAVAFFAAALVRYVHHWETTLDMAVFDQGVWLLSRGLSPQSTVIGKNLFADHVSPVLLVFAPLYRAHASAVWLLVAQAACLGLTLVPLRALAKSYDIPAWLATTVAFLSAPLWAAAVFDFHPSTLAVPALMWAVLGARRDDARLCAVAGAALVLCRADLAWGLLGVALVAGPRSRRALLPTALVGLAAALSVTTAIGGGGTWAFHYGRLGRTPLEALTHPYRILVALFSLSSLRAVTGWLLPVAFLPVLRPRWLLALVLAGIPLLVSTSTGGTHAALFQYGAIVAPLGFGGAFVALSGATGHGLRPAIGLCVMSTIALVSIGPFSPTTPPPSIWRMLREDRSDVAAAAHAVRRSEAVSATDHVLPYVAHRRILWPYPAPFVRIGPTGEAPNPPRGAGLQVQVVALERAVPDRVPLPGFELVDRAHRARVYRRAGATRSERMP